MKKWIGIFVMVMFVFTTAMPAMSHEHGYSKTSAQMEDCHHHAMSGHGHADPSSHSKHAEKDKDHRCDKGMCKCVGGNCHGMSKIFGNGSNSLSAVSASSLVFAFDNQFVDSAQPNRLKRPPKA